MQQKQLQISLAIMVKDISQHLHKTDVPVAKLEGMYYIARTIYSA